ncbi:MAG: SBBP repeat-containing protein [Ignavibacteria bacterium]|nr:SBBP repeat-containing protein [Ignavibacteria bacterium]
MKILIVLLVLLVSSSMGQVTQQWVQRYNGSWNRSDLGKSVTVDKTGNVYVIGSTANGITTDVITIKYNTSGSMLWLQIYNGPGEDVDHGEAIKVDDAGNVYVTGSSRGLTSRVDYVTIKYDSNGILKWVQRFDGTTSMHDYPTDIAIDNSGNVYVTGWSSNGALFDDFATVKYNSEGILQWVNRYNGPGSSTDIARSIAVDLTGNIYVAGYSSNTITGDNYTVIKYSSSGDTLWVRSYNGPVNGVDNLNSMSIDMNSNVYVTGRSEGSNGIDTTFDLATIKYNAMGVLQWAQRYNGPANGNEEGFSIDVDNAGNVYATGSSKGFTTASDYLTIKYSSSTGDPQWVQRYSGIISGSINTASSITIDIYGNVYITGHSGDNMPNQYDYATIRYNPDGNVQWIQRYNGPANGIDWVHSIAIDSVGNVYVTGESSGINSGMDIATIKYSQTIGIHPISTEIPVEYTLQQNYPNPFNPVTNIIFSIPKKGIVKFTVFDAAGRETAVLFNGELSAGTYNYDFDASQLASGIYFYRLEAGEFTQTKKMVLLK